MTLILFLAVSAVILGLAYRWMGRLLFKAAGIGDESPTPAHAQRDGLDYEPARWSWLLPQHFSAIAAARCGTAENPSPRWCDNT
jgi:carbon starvation protein